MRREERAEADKRIESKMPRRLGRPVLVVLLLVASAACISMGARLRLRAKPKSLEAIRHALGEEVGALFALARNPDGAAQHWKYGALRDAMNAIGTPECKPKLGMNAHKMLELLSSCWTGAPIRGCAAPAPKKVRHHKIPSKGCGRISFEAEYSTVMSHILKNGQWDDELLCGVHVVTEEPWILSVDNAIPAYDKYGNRKQTTFSDEMVSAGTEKGADFRQLVSSKFPDLSQHIPSAGGGTHGILEMKTAGKGVPLTAHSLLNAHGVLYGLLERVNAAVSVDERNPCPRKGNPNRKCKEPWTTAHLIKVDEDRDDHASDAKHYTQSVEGIWILDPGLKKVASWIPKEIQITLDIPLPAYHDAQTHGSLFIQTHIASRLVEVSKKVFISACLEHESDLAHPVGKIFGALSNVGKSDLRGMLVLTENWIARCGKTPKPSLNPQPRIDLVDVGQAFLSKHLDHIENGAQLWSALGTSLVAICKSAVVRFPEPIERADKIGGGKMSPDEKCDSLRAFFCGMGSAEACASMSLFQYRGAGWNYGAYKVKTDRGPNVEVVIEVRQMQEASNIGRLFKYVRDHHEEPRLIHEFGSLANDIRRAWNYDGEEGEEGRCVPFRHSSHIDQVQPVQMFWRHRTETGREYFEPVDGGNTVWELPDNGKVQEVKKARMFRRHQTEDGQDYFVPIDGGEAVWELPNGAELINELPREHPENGDEVQEVKEARMFRRHQTKDGQDYFVPIDGGEAVWELPRGGQVVQ